MSIFLDQNASSPMHAAVIDAMLPFIESGVIQPVAKIAAVEGSQHCLVCCDASRAGKLPLDMHARGADAPIVERKPRQPLISGDDEEQWRRGATGNVAGIVGRGKSAELVRLEIEQRRHHLQQLRDDFETRMSADSGHCGRRAVRAEAADHELVRAALPPWRNAADGTRRRQLAGRGTPGSGIERD